MATATMVRNTTANKILIRKEMCGICKMKVFLGEGQSSKLILDVNESYHEYILTMLPDQKLGHVLSSNDILQLRGILVTQQKDFHLPQLKLIKKDNGTERVVPFTKLPVEYTPRSYQLSFYHVALLFMVFVIIISQGWKSFVYTITAISCLFLLERFSLKLLDSMSEKVSRNGMMCHYKLWQLLRQILGPRLSLKLADYVRTVSASLAPCNPFQDSVSYSATTSTILASKSSWSQVFNCRSKILDLPRGFRSMTRVIPSYNFDFKEDGHIFRIGESGMVTMKMTAPNDYHFRSESRGKTLEDFSVIMSQDRAAMVLSILQDWQQQSPQVGVLGNIVERNGALYCHCLDIQAIVQGVCTNNDYFALKTLKPVVLFIGCKELNSTLTNSVVVLPTLLITIVEAIVNCLQLLPQAKTYAIVLTCIFLFAGVWISIMTGFDALFGRIVCSWILKMVFLIFGQQDKRSRFYLWMKKKECHLAFCDDFKPELHYVKDEEVPLVISGSTFKQPVGDYTTSCDIVVSIREFVPSESREELLSETGVEYSLFRDSNGREVFELEFPCCKEGNNSAGVSRRVYAVTSMITAQTTADETISTLLQVDEECKLYQWPYKCYVLFLELMLKWRQMKYGVIKSHRTFFGRTVYHVYSTHELAQRLSETDLVFYREWLHNPEPSAMVG